MNKMRKGWFKIPGVQDGDRTLEDQMKGLGWLFANVKNNTVLDVGCAEGLLSIELAARYGAKSVHGVEVVADHVVMANKLKGSKLPITFECADMNKWRPKKKYDIVVALAILQKLKDPGAVAAALANCAHEAIVLRLPPEHAPTVIDARSNNVPHHIGEILRASDFTQIEQSYDGHFGEYVGVWRRGG